MTTLLRGKLYRWVRAIQSNRWMPDTFGIPKALKMHRGVYKLVIMRVSLT